MLLYQKSHEYIKKTISEIHCYELFYILINKELNCNGIHPYINIDTIYTNIHNNGTMQIILTEFFSVDIIINNYSSLEYYYLVRYYITINNYKYLFIETKITYCIESKKTENKYINLYYKNQYIDYIYDILNILQDNIKTDLYYLSNNDYKLMISNKLNIKLQQHYINNVKL